MEAGGATGFGVSIFREAGDDLAWTVDLSDGPRRSGIDGVVLQSNDGEYSLMILADRLQDAYVDLLWEARPRCPLHEHPLTAERAGEKAVWVCPAGSGWTRPVGSLGADPEYLAAIRSSPAT